MSRLILASRSATRRVMLEAVGVPFEAASPRVDEDAAKATLRQQGLDGRAMADALAELKAIKLSLLDAGALVLGCDSVVEGPDGAILDKASTREEAGTQLRSLAGRTHRLISAAVVAERGQPVWRHVDVAKLTMRAFSDAFLEGYLDIEWPAIGGCVGGYRLEGRGGQLFARVEGSHFTILGLPLLPLLQYLRDRGIMPA